MELCARCHKRVAVVFVTRLDGNKPIQEGICLKCAKELGIRPVSDILNKMGIDDAALKFSRQMRKILRIGRYDAKWFDSYKRR